MRRNISLDFLSSEYCILRGNYWRRAQLKRTASLGLLSGQMRKIAVTLARSTTAAGQRKRISFEYRVHGEPVSHLCTKWGRSG